MVGPLIQNPCRRRRVWTRILLCAGLLSGGSALHADRVYMRNGVQLDGAIVNQNKNEITLRLNSGQVQKVQKIDILRIVYGSPPPEQIAKEEKQKQDEIARIQAYQNQMAEEQRQKEAAQKAQAAKTIEQPRQVPGNANTDAGPGPRGCAFRSAVLPGWGQFACGQTRSAIEAGALFLGAGAYAAQQNALQRHALTHYNRQSLYGFVALGQQGVFQTAIQYELVKQSRGQYHSRLQSYNQSMSILSFIYLAQIAHAYWIGRTANQSAASADDWRGEPSLSFAPTSHAAYAEVPFRDRPIVLSLTMGF